MVTRQSCHLSNRALVWDILGVSAVRPSPGTIHSVLKLIIIVTVDWLAASAGPDQMPACSVATTLVMSIVRAF